MPDEFTLCRYAIWVPSGDQVGNTLRSAVVPATSVCSPVPSSLIMQRLFEVQLKTSCDPSGDQEGNAPKAAISLTFVPSASATTRPLCAGSFGSVLTTAIFVPSGDHATPTPRTPG